MPDYRRPTPGGILLGLLLLTGCSGNPVGIEGTVTLNDAPVEAGSISFLPLEGTRGPKLSAAIEAGKYAIARDREGVPGKYRVEINWMKKTGRKIPSADPGILTEEAREAIPARYNKDSTLMEEITSGSNVKYFALTAP